MKNQLLILAILAVTICAKPLNDEKEPPNTIDKATGGGTLEPRRRIEKPNGGPGPGGHDGMADHHATLRDSMGSFNNDKIPYGPIRGPNEAANRNVRDLSGSEGVNVALGKTAYQTTTEHHTRAASRAVDGNTDTNFFSGTCTHTADAGETDPSWWVDLGQSYMVARVVIFNRQDGSQDRLNPFNIHIGDSDQVSMNPKCGGDHRIALDRPSISVSCLWMMGRYVGVRLPGPSRILTLCEVQVYTGVNVALGKTAYQTTTEHHTRAASRAVDGNTDTNFFSGTCTHTADAGETDPSWWVDLGQSYMVARVVIFNRQDGSQDRLNPFNIHIGDSDQVSMNPKCGGDHRIAPDRPSISVSCLWMMGRYVGVRLPGPSRILTLCEVQVYTGVNVALGKTAYQTTTEHHTRAASRAVDGNTDTNFFSGTCTVTADAGETDPSWWVDLGQSYMIARVVIFNRQDGSQDRLNPFNIHIGDSDQVSMNPKCGGDHRIALDRPSISVSCLWMMGRYVGVRLPGPSRILTLCEVQVYTGVNVALGKTAYQTTTEHHTRAASRAVDGNTDTNFFSGTCTVTADAGETDPSWWVDLGQSYMIARVVIFNRQDGSQDRLNPFNIHIGDSDQVSMNPKCGGDHRIALDRPSISVSCLWMMGRYVGVRLPGPSRILTLCEVQVYTGVNVALGKTAYQTTTEHHTRAASRAVDGNTDTNFFSGTCTVTADAGETDPSWWVDLGQSYMIARVVIFNRLDAGPWRLNPFNIHIGDSDQVSTTPSVEVIIASPWTGRPFPSRVRDDGAVCGRPSTRTLPKTDSPQFLTCSTATYTSLTISWVKPRAPLIGYRVTYTLVSDSPSDVISTDFGPENEKQVLRDVLADREYSVTLVAVGMYEESLSVEVNCATLTPPPEDFKLKDSTETSITVSWKQKSNSLAIGYRMWIGRSDTDESLFTQLVPTGQTDLTFSDLSPATEYVISAASTNRYSEGPAVDITVGTKTDSPTALYIEQKTTSTGTISWLPPEAVITAYNITYTGNGRSTSVMEQGDVDSCKLTGLVPGSQYDIDLVAVSRFGRSLAVSISVITDTDPPSRLNVTKSSKTWLFLEWTHLWPTFYPTIWKSQTNLAVQEHSSGRSFETAPRSACPRHRRPAGVMTPSVRRTVRVTIKCSFTAPCRGRFVLRPAALINIQKLLRPVSLSWTRPVPGQSSPVLTRAACGRVPTGSYSFGRAAVRFLAGSWRDPDGLLSCF
ncbi:hypothetical protein Bbelb_428120 [Branchiostoma belcheri]|nr:hypothetical protein Bbelb_428120 [Branchiostoma belcheri]